jgi:arsenate reductase
MLEGWLRHFSNGRFEVYSAGVETHGINPDAVFYMNEVGIDISTHTSDLIDKYLDIEFDLVITVCDHAKESCPVFPKSSKFLHHAFEDPSKASDENKVDAFRRVRGLLKDFASKFEF